MAQHVLRVTEGSVLGPWSLVEQLEKLGRFGGVLVRVGDSGLEGWRHLILEYLLEFI